MRLPGYLCFFVFLSNISADQNWINAEIGSRIVNCFYRDYAGLKGKYELKEGEIIMEGSGKGFARGEGWHGDQFQYVYQPMGPEGLIIAKMDGRDVAKKRGISGLMIRNSTKNAPYFFLGLDSGINVCASIRDTSFKIKKKCLEEKIELPVWVKLERSKLGLKGSISSTGEKWKEVFQFQEMQDSIVLAGFALSSFNKKSLVHEVFGNVRFETTSMEKPSINPTSISFQSKDLGNPLLAGTTTKQKNKYHLQASGWEIGGNEDSFHFAYQPVAEFQQFVTLVSKLDSANELSKAGIMLRTSLDSKASFIFLGITPGWGAIAIERSAPGKKANVLAMDAQLNQMPRWLKVTRKSKKFICETSLDGVKWEVISEIENRLGDGIIAGLAVTSEKGDALISSTFEFTEIRGARKDVNVSVKN